jgi:hypothetical protein
VSVNGFPVFSFFWGPDPVVQLRLLTDRRHDDRQVHHVEPAPMIAVAPVLDSVARVRLEEASRLASDHVAVIPDSIPVPRTLVEQPEIGELIKVFRDLRDVVEIGTDFAILSSSVPRPCRPC